MTEKKKKNKPEKNKRPTGDISLHVDSRQHDRYNRLHHHKSGKSITFWYVLPHRQAEYPPYHAIIMSNHKFGTIPFCYCIHLDPHTVTQNWQATHQVLAIQQLGSR